MSRQPMLRFIGVGRDYRSGEQTVRALADVTLEVAAGELVAVMGQSGSGKSTLLAIGGGLETPSSGQVWVEGTELSALHPAALAGCAGTGSATCSRTSTWSPG